MSETNRHPMTVGDLRTRLNGVDDALTVIAEALEQAERERDEARAAAECARIDVGNVRAAWESETAKVNDAHAKGMQFRRERDEARRQLDFEREAWGVEEMKFQQHLESLAHDHAKAIAERDEARAELAKLRDAISEQLPHYEPEHGDGDYCGVIHTAGHELAVTWDLECAQLRADLDALHAKLTEAERERDRWMAAHVGAVAELDECWTVLRRPPAADDNGHVESLPQAIERDAAWASDRSARACWEILRAVVHEETTNLRTKLARYEAALALAHELATAAEGVWRETHGGSIASMAKVANEVDDAIKRFYGDPCVIRGHYTASALDDSPVRGAATAPKGSK